jgi:hypothetical protein
MNGRVLHELLRDGPAPDEIIVRENLHRAAVTFPDGRDYEAELETAEVDSTVYVRGSKQR